MNAVATTAFCPTSFQLKFAFARRKPKLAFVQTRLPKIDRRRLELESLVVRSSAVNGNGLEQRSPDNSSWTNSNSAADDFSGWATGDAEKRSGDPKPKKSVVGILAAGVAGVILVAGITFAAFSISRRSTTRIGEQMEQLTAEQEESLSFDDKQNQVEGDKYGKEVEMLDSNTAESMTGKDGDPLSINENIDAIESRVSEDTGLRQSSEEGGGFGPVDVQTESAVSSNMVSPEATDKHPLHDINGDSSPIEPALDKPADASTLEPSEFVADSENSFTDSMNRLSNLNQESSLLLNPSSVGSSISNTSNESESNAIIGTSITQEELLKSGDVLSIMDVEPSKELLTIDVISSKIDEVAFNQNVEMSVEKTLNGTVLTGTPLPEDSNQSGYQNLQNNQNDIVSQPLFDSTVPGNYFTSAGIPAPSLVSPALQSPPGKVLVPAIVDQLQSQAFSALQVLKVIEDCVQPGDLCTRREYARWLVQASSALSRFKLF